MDGSNSDGQVLNARAGLPFNRRVRVVDGTRFWATTDLFEARMQIRVEADSTSRLKYDFTPHLQTSIDGEDILIEWFLTGTDSLDLKGGYFDLILSDLGTQDQNAIAVLSGSVVVVPIVTSLGGVSDVGTS